MRALSLVGGLLVALQAVCVTGPLAAQGLGGNFGQFFGGPARPPQAGDKPLLPVGPQPGLAAELRAASGRELFERKWQEKDASSPAGDGLGPRFNAGSCVDCHKQGGVGGAGPAANDVELVTLAAQKPRARPSETAKKFTALAGPAGGTTVILHKGSHDPDWEKTRFLMYGVVPPAENLIDSVKAKQWAAIVERMKDQSKPVRRVESDGVSLRISRRQTPALFGLGQIDGITDQVLADEAARQAKNPRGVSGRVAVANTERTNPYADAKQANDPFGNSLVRPAGKFGWRGQIGSLREFVLSACANELGLETPSHPQPAHPTKADYKSPGLDINQDQCEALVSFVARLPQPRQIVPTEPERAATVRLGETVFHKVGCTDCHVKNLGNVEQIYADLLLHDMGDLLTDPVPAAPDGSQGFGGYFGGGQIELAQSNPELFREWRTPPLWGVRDSAPYLHDGRAADVPTAIRMHGGEAAPSRNAFQALGRAEHDALLAFLNTLAAPEDAPR